MNSYGFTSSQKGRSPLHYASGNGHVEVVGKLLAANAHINLKDEVSTSLHVSERFRLYQGLSKISAWNTMMTRKGSRHRLTIRCLKKNKLSSERTLSTHSKQEVKRKRFTPPLLRTSPSPTRNPCHRYTPRKLSAPGHAQTHVPSISPITRANYISFPVCNFWRESFDIRLYVQSTFHWVTFLPTSSVLSMIL